MRSCARLRYPSKVGRLRTRVLEDRQGISKFEIARTVLKRLNEAGDMALRHRREIVKRIEEWEDFSTSWEQDVLRAKVLVGDVRRVRNVKDSFTRISQERDREANERRKEHQARIAAVQARTATLKALRDRFGACLALADARRRGKELEGILNDYFSTEGIAVREAFHVVGENAEGIVEQIDGAIELNGRLFLVEMKWWSKPVGAPEVADFMFKVLKRGSRAGMFIAHPGLTRPAVSTLQEGRSHGAIAFGCSLEAIYRILHDEGDLGSFLKSRIEASELDQTPYLDGISE